MGLQFHWTWLKGLSNVKCARWPWAHVLGSLDDTWSQYLKMNSSDLLIGQLVTRGLRFQYEWSNGTFIGKHVRWPWTHVLASLNDTWSQYLKLTWKTLHLVLKVMQPWVSSFTVCDSMGLSNVKCVSWPWTRFRVTCWHLVTIFNTDFIWPTYSPESEQGSQVSLYVTQWDCHMKKVLAGLEQML